jgi:hypothetical protein
VERDGQSIDQHRPGRVGIYVGVECPVGPHALVANDLPIKLRVLEGGFVGRRPPVLIEVAGAINLAEKPAKRGAGGGCRQEHMVFEVADVEPVEVV